MRRVLLAGFTLLVFCAGYPARAQNQFLGTWAVIAAVPAPWYTADPSGPSPANPTLRNARIEFQPTRLIAPTPFACANPHYAVFPVPPEGLFEGGLLDPAHGLTTPAATAATLGFPPGDSSTLETRCHGIRFHLAGADQMLFALDNVVYTLRRVPKR
jgi:hypothetical protein